MKNTKVTLVPLTPLDPFAVMWYNVFTSFSLLFLSECAPLNNINNLTIRQETEKDYRAVEAFDATFPPKEKKWMPSQEEFYIYSNSSVVR